MKHNDDDILYLYAKIGALTHGCTKALELLKDPNGDDFQADKVIDLLKLILNNKG